MSEKKINLSYVLTTFNKIEYLKVTLPYLIDAKQHDEEIIVVDGGSSDGTGQYLMELLQEGKIDAYLSESDFGESHGTNKGFLLAQGELIKLITDDDAYFFEGIRFAKDFMLNNKEYDVLGFDGLIINTSFEVKKFEKQTVFNKYLIWKEHKIPFIFCGLSIMIRKSSLPLMGLWSTTFKMIDFEYTLRITSLPVRIAWYNGRGYCSIANQNSNSVRMWETLKKEWKIVHKLYLNKRSTIMTPKRFLVSIRDIIYKKKVVYEEVDIKYYIDLAHNELNSINREIEHKIFI
jgi:glycosyltransferase involved in cell wall biosynthesis